MTYLDFAGRAMTSLAAALLLFVTPAQAETTKPPCRTQQDLIRLGGSLSHVASKIDAGKLVTVVAIGSSSTAGAGATCGFFSINLTHVLRRRTASSSFGGAISRALSYQSIASRNRL